MKKLSIIIISLVIALSMNAQEKDHKIVGSITANTTDGEIMKVNSNMEFSYSKETTQTYNSSAHNSSTESISIDNKRSLLSLQAAFTHYKFTSPILHGHKYTYSNGNSGYGDMSGFADLSGAYAQLNFFINQNLSVNASYGNHEGENTISYNNNTYGISAENRIELSYIRFAFTGRIIGENYPVRLSLSMGAGYGLIDAEFIEDYHDLTTSTYSHYEGEADFFMIYFQSEVAYPVFKGLFLFAQYEYTIGLNGSLEMRDNSGSNYKEIRYEQPGYGGNVIKIGIGYEFNRKN